MSWPAISQNLAVLRRSGAVTERRVGTRRLYLADQQAHGPLAEVIRSMWASDLDTLRLLAEAEETRGRVVIVDPLFGLELESRVRARPETKTAVLSSGIPRRTTPRPAVTAERRLAGIEAALSPTELVLARLDEAQAPPSTYIRLGPRRHADEWAPSVVPT